MYIIYLKRIDMLRDEHYPVAPLLNEACCFGIIEFLRNLVQGIGSGYNFSDCSFWDDLDEYEQAHVPKYEGLWIENEAEQEVILSYKDLLYYLELLYDRLKADNFSKLSEVRELINEFKAKYC